MNQLDSFTNSKNLIKTLESITELTFNQNDEYCQIIDDAEPAILEEPNGREKQITEYDKNPEQITDENANNIELQFPTHEHEEENTYIDNCERPISGDLVSNHDSLSEL